MEQKLKVGDLFIDGFFKLFRMTGSKYGSLVISFWIRLKLQLTQTEQQR